MTRIDVEAALAAANPLSERTVAELPLHDAETELLAMIAAAPADGQRRPRTDSPRPRARAHWGRRLVVVLAASAAVAAVLALLPGGERTGGPSPAFAASLVRFANASPLVLLRLPGWHVVYVYQQPDGYGEMHFVRGGASADGSPTGVSSNNGASLANRFAMITWYRVTPAALRKYRKYLAVGHQHANTGLGVVAQRYVYEGRSRRGFDMTAFLIYRGRELSFRATVTSMSMFRSELRALTAVDTTTWLRAMPPSVVKSADSSQVVHQMLKGIPLPPRFDASRIRGSRLVQNRYDLGAAVTGTVACMWIADWKRARQAGDDAAVDRAIAAMATAPHWPVLHQMARHGAWPQVLISYARAMRRGTVTEGGVQPLAVAVNSGLGCRELGVKLGR
jgi:hypothetical protein